MSEDLRFDEFYTAVGRDWPERRVRNALEKLNLHAYGVGADGRRRRYAASWVSQVQAYLKREETERKDLPRKADKHG